MTPIINLVLRTARQFNEYLVQSIEQRDPASSDLQSDLKLMSHLETSLFQNLMDTLKRGYPTHYLAEPGETLREEKEDSWHIYGFDAKDQFCRRLPTACYSVEHRHKGKTVDAIVINPFSGDEYTASRGKGCALNNRRTRCTNVTAVDQSVVANNTLTQVPSLRDSQEHAIELVTSIAQSSKGFSSTGNPMLDCVYVAAGQADAALLTQVDTEALRSALLICQEAGCLSGTLNGGVIQDSRKRNIAVSNPKLYKALVQRFSAFDSKLS